MRRSELKELHYITTIENIPSILRRGILSHKRSQKIDHISIAASEIKDRRAKVTVPGGKLLHEYANLYICGRNPMLYKRKARHESIAVLKVSPDILDLPGVIVTDMNAAAANLYVSFRAAPEGLRIVDRELTFAEYWTDANEVQYFRKKSAKCAEVLVLDSVDPKYITGCYVSCEQTRARVAEIAPGLSTTVDTHLFFL